LFYACQEDQLSAVEITLQGDAWFRFLLQRRGSTLFPAGWMGGESLYHTSLFLLSL